MPVATLVMGAIQFLAILELKPGATVPGCADDGASDSALFGEEYFPWRSPCRGRDVASVILKIWCVYC